MNSTPIASGNGKTGQPRRGYRHGDLRQALLEAGIDLAREGGPDAVVLREATRRTGVVPNAAYRHFANRDALLAAVRATALSRLALAMEDELSRIDRSASPAQQARDSLSAVGRGYLTFARKETGLFRTAFWAGERVENDQDPAKTGQSGLNPFQLLGQALDEMVAANILPRARRADAEYLAWSAVHGLAVLSTDGPLQAFGPAELTQIGQKLLAMVEHGL